VTRPAALRDLAFLSDCRTAASQCHAAAGELDRAHEVVARADGTANELRQAR
jgi:hypothetical protein